MNPEKVLYLFPAQDLEALIIIPAANRSSESCRAQSDKANMTTSSQKSEM